MSSDFSHILVFNERDGFARVILPVTSNGISGKIEDVIQQIDSKYLARKAEVEHIRKLYSRKGSNEE